MRKMIVRIPNRLLECCAPFAGIAGRFEIIGVLKLTQAAYTDVCRITLKEGMSLDAARNRFVTDTIVLSHEGNDYTLLMKGRISEEIADFTARFELRVDYPIIFDSDFCQFGVIGTSDELQNIVNAAKDRQWNMEIVAVHDYNPLVSGLLDELTEKQREILKAAYRYGYFEHPRKIDAAKLADKIGVHKTTLLEHLHKAEKRLVRRVLDEAGPGR